MPTRNPRGRPAHPDLLTPAEWRVAEAIRHGLSNPAIARLLGVSTEAVKFHAANCLQKLGWRAAPNCAVGPESGGIARFSHRRHA